MTLFWSTWICVLTLGSLIGLTWINAFHARFCALSMFGVRIKSEIES